MVAPCVTGIAYTVKVDWVGDGDFIDAGDDVTGDVLERGDIVLSYGRDQTRELAPTEVGQGSFRLCNVGREYSPENTSSPLNGMVLPNRNVAIDGSGVGLFRGTFEEYVVHPDRSDRSVDINALDGMALLRNRVTTSVYASIRTGTAIGYILDAVGWTGARDIDPGATIIRWWWEDDNPGLDALTKIVNSEGPPAVAYVAPNGTFVFKDRHHRLFDAASLTSQGTYAAARLGCTAPAVTGTHFDYLAPFGYDHGFRDIYNKVAFTVDERGPATEGLVMIWSMDTPITLAAGQTYELVAKIGDPFIMAETPVEDVDYVVMFGNVSVVLTRDSGGSTTIQITASGGGSAQISGMQLRAISLPIKTTYLVNSEDTSSITKYGQSTYPNDAPWASIEDARALAAIILGHYSERRPVVTLNVVNQDLAHHNMILQRTISDRITVRNDELGLNADFYVEHVSHNIKKLGQVHYATFGCERTIDQVTNVFQFDVAGHGFDQGVFGLSGLDSPSNMFRFDVAGHGFDDGLFAT